MLDAERMLRGARRPLVIGMGGGGDVVGALATAESLRIYDGADPIVGGVAWERRPIDPAPGPRRVDEIADASELAPGIMLAGASTRVSESGVYFAESRMAEYLGRETLLIDIEGGPRAVADGLEAASAALDSDLLIFIDVGGDVLAQGSESGLRSPLCDAVMLAVGASLAQRGRRILAGIFGIGCDAELTPAEVLSLLAKVAGAGGLCGARGLTDPVASRLEGAMDLVPTEASRQAVRAFRGASGTVPIRGGQRAVELTPAATLTFYLDIGVTMRTCGRLAQAVHDARSLAEANRALNDLGVYTELDLETDAARQ